VTLHVDEKITDLDDFLLVLRHLHPVKDGFHSENEFPWTERLGDIVIRAEFESDDSINFFRFGREHEDWDRRCCRIGLEGSADFLAIHSWKHKVEDDKSRPIFLAG